MRFGVDTTLLVYAVNSDCPEHAVAKSLLDGWLAGTVAWAVTWGIVYEFLRLVTTGRRDR